MGGEHIICFHKHHEAPCYFIHDNDFRTIELDDKDLEYWRDVKSEIIDFMQIMNKGNIKRFENFQSPKDVKIIWTDRNKDDKYIGVMHDIAKILILAFPGKFCYDFDRCYLDEFYDNNYSSLEYSYYMKIPKFSYYTLSDKLKQIISERNTTVRIIIHDKINRLREKLLHKLENIEDMTDEELSKYTLIINY